MVGVLDQTTHYTITPTFHHSNCARGTFMPDYKEILYEKQRGGVLITLNRPEALNAITRPMLKEFTTPSTRPKPIRKFVPSSSPARAGPSAPVSIRQPAVAGAAIFNGRMEFKPA